MKKLVGILILAACLVGFSLPASAANLVDNLSLDGHVGIFTAWTHQDDDFAGGDSRTDLKWNPHDTFYLDLKYEVDRFMTHMVLDNNDLSGTGSTNEGVLWDKAYAKVDFDAFSLKFGYDNPLSFAPGGNWRDKYTEPNMGKTIGGSDKYHVSFIIPVDKSMKFELLLGGPTTAYADAAGAAVVDTEATLPVLEVAFTSYKPFMWKVFGGYQTYEATFAATGDKDIDSAFAAVQVAPSLGPLNFVATLSYSTNQYMVQGPGYICSPAFSSTVYDGENDTERLGFHGSVMYDITEMFSAALTVGYQKFEADGGDYEDPGLGYGVSFPIHVTDNLEVRPYVYVDDFDTVKNDGPETEQGKMTEFGVYWNVSF